MTFVDEKCVRGRRCGGVVPEELDRRNNDDISSWIAVVNVMPTNGSGGNDFSGVAMAALPGSLCRAKREAHRVGGRRRWRVKILEDVANAMRIKGGNQPVIVRHPFEA